MSDFRFRVEETSDLTKQEKHPKKHSTIAIQSEKHPRKQVGALARLLWRAAAAGLKPLCLPRARNEASSCPGICTRTLRFHYVASSPGSPLPHLQVLDGHRKLVGSSAIPARSCPEPVWYYWGSIVELEVPSDETPGLMTLHPHNTNVLQSITYAKSPYPFDRSNLGQKN